ncbi:hypothetical protein ILUMI_01958 [Ignelater luminosus]|uniref:Uncharacterized protein n=1 Tax=Ignelater luminosus TaxID=2038154 RepID=A0A8K0DIL7_IGNLU|nr:hypothetical protein ILUMI_01958 [Ignelater luminosus]
MNEKIDILERGKRRNSVVIQGTKVDTSNQKEMVNDMKKFIKEELKIEVEIKAAGKIGNAICLLEMADDSEKEVLQNKNIYGIGYLANNVAILMLWRAQKDHVEDCCFCFNKTAGLNRRKKRKYNYVGTKSAQTSQPHAEYHPVSQPPIEPETEEGQAAKTNRNREKKRMLTSAEQTMQYGSGKIFEFWTEPVRKLSAHNERPWRRK